jgi:hypothetical protein
MSLSKGYVRVPFSFLNECFSYTKDGRLIWKLRPKDHFKTEPAWKGWFTRCYGKPIGVMDKQGYLNLALHYSGKIQRLHVHRVIMCLHLGRDLGRTEVVDHIDRNKLNNEIDNLRLVNHSVNAENTGVRSNNETGHKYVWNRKGRFKVEAKVKSGRFFVGYYDTLEDALSAQKTFYEENI